ncbi:MAG: spore maturation protein [Eubacteriales bacterium]|nr:spore maturation protein [Eubacteriales bacterium]
MDLVMPCVIAFVVTYALIKKVRVFDVFVIGAKDGIKTLYNIAPTLIGLIVSVTMLKSSGALDLLSQLIEPLTEKVGYPSQLVPMTILRPISGGGSTALLNQVLSDYGPDSYLGRCASVLAGASETTFYAVTLYYGAVKVKKIRHTLIAALVADFTAAVFSVLTVNLFF